MREFKTTNVGLRISSRVFINLLITLVLLLQSFSPAFGAFPKIQVRDSAKYDTSSLAASETKILEESTFSSLSVLPPVTRPVTGTISSTVDAILGPDPQKLYLPLLSNSKNVSSVPADDTVLIDSVYVDGSNNMQVTIRGTPGYYRLYVRRVGATFGDPGKGYYQVYPSGVWDPKWLVNVVINVSPDTVYCVEIKSNDGSYRHDITSVKSGSGYPRYTNIYIDGDCPVDFSYPRLRLVGSGASLWVNPNTPVQGEATQATFGTVCNDGAVTADLSNAFVSVNTGENWGPMNLGSLICGQCTTVGYNQTRTFSSGSKYAIAGYYSGGWHAYETRDGATNYFPFNVLTPADVRLKSGTSLSTSASQISPGQSVTAQFTVYNYGGAQATERFRAVILDETGANVVASFAETGDINIPVGGEYSYNQTFTFATSGIYWIRAQHRMSGVWTDLAGNGTKPLRVFVPPPEGEPKVKGYPPHCPYAGEPVNTATGNFVSEHTDLKRPGPGIDFVFKRFYNALDADSSPGPLGYGWTHSFQHRLQWRDDDTVVLTLTDGHIVYFVGALGVWPDNKDPGTYQAEAGVFDTLVRDTHGTPGVWGDDTFIYTTPDQVRYYFDTQQRLVRIEERSGNAQTLSYASGKLTQIVDTAGVIYAFSYTGSTITGLTTSNGESIHYSYDAAGNLISFTNTAGDSMFYTYDANHRLLTGVDTSGRLFVENVYDSQGRVIEQYDADGNLATFNYAPTGLMNLQATSALSATVYLDARGNPLTQYYDDQYRLVKEVDALGGVISYTYDVDSNVIAMRDKNGNLTRYTYDGRGNMLSKIDALGGVWLYTYDARNNLLSQRDPLGNTNTYVYDAQGRMIQKADPTGGVEEYSYNSQGLVIWHKDAAGAQTWYTYNALGLPVSVTNALGQVTTLGYNALGQKISYTDAAGNSVAYQYDEMGRVTHMTAPDGGITLYTYDGMGNLLSETNPLDYIRTFTYNVFNQLVAETDRMGNITRHEYDALGRRLRDIDPLGYSIDYEYDALGRLTKQVDKNGNQTTYTYDANGNRLTETNPLGFTTTYVYDVLNRLVEIIGPSCCGFSHRYMSYDAAGRLVQETDALGNETHYTYDAAGRLVSKTDALGYVTTYAYDAAGRLVLETDALGHQTHNTYDLLGQLVSTTDRLGHVTSQVYDSVGRVTETTNPRGFTTHQVYDSADRLLQTIDPLGNATSYTYDLSGNVLSQTDALGNSRAFTYDANGNLISETDPRGNITRFAYDPRGNMVQKIDALGNIWRYVYDPNGNLIREIDPLGNLTAYQYDALNRAIRQVDPLGNQTISEYDAAGNLAGRTDAEGNTWLYTYDANHNRVAETDPLGHTTYYEYDALNRQVKMIDALGGSTLTYYDPLGRVAETVKPTGGRTGYTYDAEGHLLIFTDELGFYSTYQYDAAGNQVQSANRLGVITSFAYDALDRQISITDALGSVTRSEYDALGRLAASINALGRTTRYAYDPAGNLLTETDAMGGVTSYTYDALNQQISAIDTAGNATITVYDALGRVSKVIRPSGAAVTYAYDRAGNRLSEIDPAGRVQRWVYDRLGRMVQEIDPLDNITASTYDAVGNLIVKRDALGHETGYAYDAMDRLAEVTDAMGYQTRYVYDPLGNLVREINANGYATVYGYDVRSQKIHETNPLGSTWQYQYDAEMRQTAQRKPDGVVIQYHYDNLGRLILTEYADDTPDVRFTYNIAGQRLSMIDGTGTTRYTYDALDRLTGIVYASGKRVGYRYNAIDQRVGVIYPDGMQVTYAFDPDGNLQFVSTPEGLITYQRDASGLVQLMQYPNGAGIRYEYDADGRLVEMSNFNPDGDFATYSYTLDALGNRVQKVELLVEGGVPSTFTTNYSYDARGELTISFSSDGIQSYYEFDAAGNRTRVSGVRLVGEQPSAYMTDYEYNGANQLLEVVDGVQGLTGYAYNANGNRIFQLAVQRKVDYTYDAENRLTTSAVQVLENGQWIYLEGQVEAYLYDGQSRRVQKRSLDSETGTQLWRQVYTYGDDWNVLEQRSGSIATTYVFDDQMQQIQSLAGNISRFLHFDGLESLVGFTLGNGGLQAGEAMRRFDDYGQLLRGDAEWSNYAYTGHEFDAYSELYYAKHRYYDPQSGLWLTLDGYRGERNDPLSRHRYLYVQSNPIHQYDPLGMKLESLGGLGLWKYCDKHHPGTKAHLKKNIIWGLGDFGQNWAWRCAKYSWLPLNCGAGINYHTACQDEYGAGAFATLMSSDPYGIKCFKHVKGPDPVVVPPIDLIDQDPTPSPDEQACDFVFPTEGGITNPYKIDDPSTEKKEGHSGVDIGKGASPGTVPVYAAHAGRVSYVGEGHKSCSGYKYAVTIRSNEKIGGKYILTLYNHMGHWATKEQGFYSYIEVSRGQNVSKGQLIGYQGDFPQYHQCGAKSQTSGVHLHFEVHVREDRPFKESYNNWSNDYWIDVVKDEEKGIAKTVNPMDYLGCCMP